MPVSFLSILTFGIFLILIVLLFRFFIFKKVTVTYGEFKGSRVVYRIVKGDFQALQKEQSIFTRRALSLWGKEMRSWPTFRITFPNFFNKYAIFGIIVPDTFNCDKECLEELGFKFGSLDSLPLAAKIEIPTRLCYSLKLNQYRALKTFKLLFKSKLHKKINDIKKNHINDAPAIQKQKQTSNINVCSVDNTESGYKENKKLDTLLVDTIINETNQNNGSNDRYISTVSDNDFSGKINIDNYNHDEINNHRIDEIGNQINDNDSDIQNKYDMAANDDFNYNVLKEKNDQNNNDQPKNRLFQHIEKGPIPNHINIEARIESLADDPPFAEIRYKKKKKQIFITPLMNYNELVGLWVPDD